MEPTRIDELKADNLAARQYCELAVSLQRSPKAVAGKDSPRQDGEIALGLIDRVRPRQVPAAARCLLANLAGRV